MHISMNTQQRAGSLQGLAMVIARRLTLIKQIAAEQGKPPPSAEVARQFKLLCDNSSLRYGPPSTREMELLAVELVPRAIHELTTRYEAVVQHKPPAPRELINTNFFQSKAA